MTGIEKAVALYDGSPSRMAAAVGSGVVRQHIEHWIKVGQVPAAKAPLIAAATGIPLGQLCPSVDWQAAKELSI